MKKFLIALLVGLLAASGAEAEGKKITAAADPWPPFIDPRSPTQGLSMEILRAAVGPQGYEVELHFMPWSQVEERVTAGEIDVIPHTWTTEERRKHLLFSEPYAVNEVKFVKRKGDPFEYEGIESLSGKTVGIVRGYGYPETFKGATNFRRREANDTLSNVKRLVFGLVDLTLEDRIVLVDTLRKSDPALLDEIELTKNSLSTQTLSVSCALVNPRCQEIIDAFNRGFEEIKANGTLERILAGYRLK